MCACVYVGNHFLNHILNLYFPFTCWCWHPLDYSVPLTCLLTPLRVFTPSRDLTPCGAAVPQDHLGGTGLSFMAPVPRTGNQERVTADPHELAQPPGSDSPHGRLSQKNPPLFLEQEAGLWKVGMRWKFPCLLPFTCSTASVQLSIWTCGRCCSCSSSSACAPATKVRT